MNKIITQVNEVTPNQLLEMLLNGLIENQKELLKSSNQQPQNKYLTRKEVSKLLSISLPTLHDWVKRGLIKSYRCGNRVFFKSSEIEQSLKQIKF
jgi:excisionase family DNA binding protein